MRNIKLILLGFILISCVSAQQFSPQNMPKIGIVSGVVVDSISNAPIQYASISIFNKINNEIVTGGITDDNGKFNITQIPLGRYDVSIEFIGYKRKIIESIALNPRENTTTQNLGNIKLVQTSLAYEDVNVEAERPLFTQTIDKKIFNVEQNNISSGGSAIDALRQVPGVDVDIDGNVSLRGSSKINILVDGKPAILSGGDTKTILENIPSDNIKDIEVVTNPSAKYDPEGMAGIINVVLKENRFAGMNGNVKSGANSLGSYNGSGQLNFRNDRFNIFTNIGARHDVRGGGGDSYRETELLDFTSILDQEIDADRGGDNLFVKSGIEYFLNPNNTFGLSVTYSDGNRIHDGITVTDQIEEYIIKFDRIFEGDNDRQKLDFGLTYDRKFANPKQKLSANFQVSTNKNNSKDSQVSDAYSGYEDLVDPDVFESVTDNKYNTNDLQVDYTHPFNKNTKLEVGYKGTDRSIDNLYESFNYNDDLNEFEFDDDASSDFLYSELIHSGYGVFSTQMSKLGLQLGLRGENVDTRSELKDTNEIFDNPYTSFYPSFAISYGPPQLFQVQLNYSKRVNRPSFRRLNPTVRSHDRNSFRTGNPFLKPEYIDVAEINLSRFKKGLSISLGSYYRRITDKMSRYKYIRDDGVAVVTYENYDSQQTYGLEAIISGSLGKKFRIMVNGNVYADEVNASNVFEDYDNTATGYTGRFTGTWNAAPTFEVMLMGFYRSPRDMPIGRVESMSFASISAKKKLLDDKLSISLNIRDIFNTMGFTYRTSGENYFQENSRKWDSQSIGLQLEYKFGSIEDRSSYNRNRNGTNGENGNGGDEFEIE